jgi:hypothetical protein
MSFAPQHLSVLALESREIARIPDAIKSFARRSNKQKD